MKELIKLSVYFHEWRNYKGGKERERELKRQAFDGVGIWSCYYGVCVCACCSGDKKGELRILCSNWYFIERAGWLALFWWLGNFLPAAV